eukprot:jgi/Botrbrau1/10437/Bobra.0133s0044.1
MQYQASSPVTWRASGRFPSRTRRRRSSGSARMRSTCSEATRSRSTFGLYRPMTLSSRPLHKRKQAKEVCYRLRFTSTSTSPSPWATAWTLSTGQCRNWTGSRIGQSCTTCGRLKYGSCTISPDSTPCGSSTTPTTSLGVLPTSPRSWDPTRGSGQRRLRTGMPICMSQRHIE